MNENSISATAAFCTPTLTVRSNRDTVVRTLRYNRELPGGQLDERVKRTTYDALGRVASHIDARFFTSAGSPSPNFAYQTSLSGRVLRTESVDAGTQWALADVEAHLVWARDGRGIVSTWTHDELGRPTTLLEVVGEEASATRDVWIYGEQEPNAQANNLRGRCVRLYDTAGKLSRSGFRLTGQPTEQTRQLLADAENDPDWTGEESSRASALDPTTYTTQWLHDAIGAWHTQTDAKGNVQQRVTDVAGRLASSSVKLATDKQARPVLTAIDYSAAGQVRSETAGNGAVSTYSYEPQTQRLIRLTVTRAVQANRRATVQDLSYAYDPVGNIVRICDAAQATTFWRNQKIAPARIYGYDALYQLISATGREMATRAQQSQTLPPAAIPLPSDDMVYTNYSRTYSYDRGGNLTQIQHQGVASYTQAIVVSNRSNHAVQQNAKGTLTPDGIDGSNGTWFDASGNQQQLLPDQTQPLTWNGRNELTRVTLLRRSGADGENDDREVYQYGEDGIRVRKRMTTQAKSVTRTVEAIYLPGLTLRVTSSGDGKTMTVTESLEEISSSAAGNIHVRCLHWAMGLPASLTNDLVRYGVGDRSGSIGLELDDHANAISREEYYPYGGTAVWTARSLVEADTKYVRYSGKERDATGLYEYGYRYYQPWIGRWLSPDPAGLADGLNLYRMVHNDPVSLRDMYGLAPGRKRNAEESIHELAESVGHDVGSNEEGGHAARPAAALEPETIASILGDAIKASYSYFPLKSYNKSYLDTSNLTGYKAWFYSDGIREARARITDKLISTTKNLDSESEVFGVIKRSRMAGKALAGNCGLLSTPAFFYLLEKRERLNQLFHKDVNISIVDLEDPYDHTFISVNHPAGAWGPLSSNTKEWPADTWIVDPWAKIVSPANEYEERWTAKLQKWADRGLAIGGADGNHMTDPKWRDAIRNSEKVVAYSDEMERKYG